MDKQKVNTKFSIGRKGNSSSSHYRIKSGEVNIQLMAVIAGNKPSEQTELLLCKLPHRHVFIAAYLTRIIHEEHFPFSLPLFSSVG